MKLAEALIERADLQRKLSQLRGRLSMNAQVQEDETPAEDPLALLREVAEASAALETLVLRINLTNASTVVDGETLTALLARRDAQTQRVEIQRDFLDQASETVRRGARSEIRIRPTVAVAALREETDSLAKTLRALDTKIQGLNWTVDLM